jgi:hypothetical protein
MTIRTYGQESWGKFAVHASKPPEQHSCSSPKTALLGDQQYPPLGTQSQTPLPLQ